MTNLYRISTEHIFFLELRYIIPGYFPVDKIDCTFYKAFTCTKTLIHVDGIILDLFTKG